MTEAEIQTVVIEGELSTKLEACFGTIDEDTDGFITVGEAAKMFKTFKKLEVAEMLKAMDDNHDSELTLSLQLQFVLLL